MSKELSLTLIFSFILHIAIVGGIAFQKSGTAHSMYQPTYTSVSFVSVGTEQKVSNEQPAIKPKKNNKQLNKNQNNKIQSKINTVSSINSMSLITDNSSVFTVTPPVELNFPKPSYPVVARKRGIEGAVLLAIHIEPSGSAHSADIIESSGHDVLDKAALTVIKDVKYSPARSGSTPVAYTVKKYIRFELQ